MGEAICLSWAPTGTASRGYDSSKHTALIKKLNTAIIRSGRILSRGHRDQSGKRRGVEGCEQWHVRGRVGRESDEDTSSQLNHVFKDSASAPGLSRVDTAGGSIWTDGLLVYYWFLAKYRRDEESTQPQSKQQPLECVTQLYFNHGTTNAIHPWRERTHSGCNEMQTSPPVHSLESTLGFLAATFR